MDTKYKLGNPTAGDIEHIAAYAEAKGCKEAILVYQGGSDNRLNGIVGDIRIRSATFSLSDDPDLAGRRFVKESLGIEIT
jgi:5-methylcytosine-specific restriction enzyme subunit McrC